MKNFTPLQITVLAVLTVIGVALAIFAFATGNNLASDPIDIAEAQASPEIVYIELANTPSPSPVPIPMPTATPTVSPTASPTATPSQTREGDGLFALDILGDEISVAYGVEESTLEKTPGWLTSSVLPGQDGMCVVYGHRNRNHLKILEKVERGDTITVTMDGATYIYTVSDVTIYESSSDMRLPTVDGKTLVLVTCYPFQYSGHAPGKYLVIATLTANEE